MMKAKISISILLLIVTSALAQLETETPDWSDNDDFFNSTEPVKDTVKEEESSYESKKKSMREEKAPQVKEEKTSSPKSFQIGASGLAGFSVGGGMGDLNLNYSVQLLMNDRIEFYAVAGHTLGFDKFRKVRIGAGYYWFDPEAFRVGTSLEVGPAYMQRESETNYAKGSAWLGGRVTAGYRFSNGFFVDGYAILSIAPDMINEAGVRAGYYF